MFTSEKLTAGGVAVVGRTGSGKSTMFHGSEYVRDVAIADTGSQGHRVHHKGGGTVEMILPTNPKCSPIQFVREWVTRMEAEGRLWLLDSWSALEWQQCAWFKANVRKSGNMYQDDHKTIVNELRDLALILATARGFTLFNTGNGGVIKNDYTDGDGKKKTEVIHSPKGALTGYPSLSGCSPGTETVLARWSTVWVLTPGTPAPAEGPHLTPRGLILPWDDFRGGDFGSYVPIKDVYAVLSAGKATNGGSHEVRQRVDPSPAPGVCFADALLDRIAAKWPSVKESPRRKVRAEKSTPEVETPDPTLSSGPGVA